MDVIGKVQASIASASQETTLALANANFDMSLIRIEAPPEYKPLGSVLAKRKRNVAEDGPAHVTARRLGSLFQGILPETPNLIKAYGTRASEIAQSPVVNPKGTNDHGPFKDYVGVDGTSIWAAATSGSAAIAAHLLACFIATCWAADEATAIWMELVAERKRRIQAKAATAEYFDLSEAVSSKLELDQTQLANWDASARSWLRAANDSPVVAGRQKTVRSILDRVNMTVRNQQDLYTSVTEAWRLSLETMEKLITGSSYSIEDGSVVVALLSWHIYPDLIVLGSRPEDILQDDDLVEPGGCVTVGLRFDSPSLSEKSGVHWSLSLAHLRYYGVPKTTSRSLTNTPSGHERFTREEFTLILIGVIIARWQAEVAVSVDDALSFIRLVISKLVELFQSDHPEQLGSWIQAFLAASDEYYAVDSQVKGLARKFVNLGLRNQSLFVDKSRPSAQSEPNMRRQSRFSLFGFNSLRFAKALEDKKDQEKFFMASMKRLTCISVEGHQPPRKFVALLERKAERNSRKLFIFTTSELKGLDKLGSSQDSISKSEQGGYYIANVRESVRYSKKDSEYLWSNPPKPVRRYMKRHYSQQDSTLALHFNKVIATSHFVLLEPDHKYRIGEGLLVLTRIQHRQEIEDYLLRAKLAKYEIFKLFARQPISQVLRTHSRMWDLYDNLPGSTISPNILNCNLTYLSHSLYSPGLDTVPLNLPSDGPHSRDVMRLLRMRPLSHISGRDCAFKTLVTFEAGVDVLMMPSVLDWNYLVAVSTDDSLYINPSSLGTVTSPITSSMELRRVRGNVGRPGMNLIGWFTPTMQTEWRQPRMDMWQVVNHNPFQGKLEDAFSGTSLHLNVTGWARELDFGGNKCVPDGAYVEAVVSAHDAGMWLGDLSFQLLSSPRLCIVREKKDCRRDTPVIGSMPPEDLVLVENWEELLTPHPTQPAVVMCHGNWQARLTATSLSLGKGYRTLLFDGHGCWHCAFSHLHELKLKEAKKRRKRRAYHSNESSSDDSTSSSETTDKEYGEEEEEERIAPSSRSDMTITAQQTASDGQPTTSENQIEPGKGDDATLVDQNNSHSNLVEGLTRSTIDDLGDDSDSGSSTTLTSSSSEGEDEDIDDLPYIPTVFIL